jgi:hypothetical protein
VYQVDWIDDKTLLLNAATDALSDLYTYLPLTRESKRLTTDFYDDLNASYGTLMGQKGILLKSNRALDSYICHAGRYLIASATIQFVFYAL